MTKKKPQKACKDDPVNYPFRPILRVVRAAYKIPNSVTVAHFIPALRYTHHPLPDDGILVTVGQIASGLRFPLTRLDREVLNFYGISPGQGTGNFWRILFLSNRANRLLKKKITVKDIRIHFHLQINPKQSDPYFYFVKRHKKDHLIKNLRDSDRQWLNFPIVVKGKWEASEESAVPPLKHRYTVREGYNIDLCGPEETSSEAIDELLALDSDQYTRYARVDSRGDPLPESDSEFDDEDCRPPLYTPRKAQTLKHQVGELVGPSTSYDFIVGEPTGENSNASLDLSISDTDSSYFVGESSKKKPDDTTAAENLDNGSNPETSQNHTMEFHVNQANRSLDQLAHSVEFFHERIKQLNELSSSQAEEIKNLYALKNKNQKLKEELESVKGEKRSADGKIRELEMQITSERDAAGKEHQKALANVRKSLIAEKEEALASQKATLKRESDAEFVKLKAKYQNEVYEFKAKYKQKFAKAI